MLAPVTRQYADLSTAERFEFLFYCDRCGWQWRSEAYAFDPNGFEPPIDEKIRVMLWRRQHEEAYERANREAGLRFSRCPVCGCRICDDCLYRASSGQCRDCIDEQTKKQ